MPRQAQAIATTGSDCLRPSSSRSREFSDDEIVRQARGLRLIHLFSGPSREEDGMGVEVRRLGAEMDERDILHGPQSDLADEAVWTPIIEDIKGGEYDGGFAGPPCSTFSSSLWLSLPHAV